MVWFIVGLLVLLAGGAAVLFVVFHATGADDSAPFAPDDASPTGDTSQHAGEDVDGDGETEGRQGESEPVMAGPDDGTEATTPFPTREG